MNCLEVSWLDLALDMAVHCTPYFPHLLFRPYRPNLIQPSVRRSNYVSPYEPKHGNLGPKSHISVRGQYDNNTQFPKQSGNEICRPNKSSPAYRDIIESDYKRKKYLVISREARDEANLQIDVEKYLSASNQQQVLKN